MHYSSRFSNETPRELEFWSRSDDLVPLVQENKQPNTRRRHVLLLLCVWAILVAIGVGWRAGVRPFWYGDAREHTTDPLSGSMENQQQLIKRLLKQQEDELTAGRDREVDRLEKDFVEKLNTCNNRITELQQQQQQQNQAVGKTRNRQGGHTELHICHKRSQFLKRQTKLLEANYRRCIGKVEGLIIPSIQRTHPLAVTQLEEASEPNPTIPTSSMSTAPDVLPVSGGRTIQPVKLRHSWSGRSAHSQAARQLLARQSDCSKPQIKTVMTSSGMGSDLHMWSESMHNAHLAGASLVVVGKWKWEDKHFCVAATEYVPLSCYFANTRPCPLNSVPLGSSASVRSPLFSNLEESDPRLGIAEGERIIQPRRTAAMELLFSNVSDTILDRTRHAATHIFGYTGSPDQMITVHIRWSDKGREAKLQRIGKYIEAVTTLVKKHSIPSPVSIFVMSEDVSALAAFKQSANPNWRIFHYDYDDPAAIASHRTGEIDALKSSTTNEQKEELFYTFGKDKTNVQGAWSLITLLLSLESQYFVLTTSSNWSRLVNELRESILDVDCDRCTDFVDLQHSWYNQW